MNYLKVPCFWANWSSNSPDFKNRFTECDFWKEDFKDQILESMSTATKEKWKFNSFFHQFIHNPSLYQSSKWCSIFNTHVNLIYAFSVTSYLFSFLIINSKNTKKVFRNSEHSLYFSFKHYLFLRIRYIKATR